MSGDLFLYVGLILAGFSLFWGIYSLFSNMNSGASLSWAANDAPVRSKSSLIEFSRPLVHQLTLKYAFKVINPNYRQRVVRTLLTAGMENELNVDEFIGLQILWGAFLPLMLIILNFALQLGYSWPLFILIVPIGGLLPFLHTRGEKKRRYTSVVVDLPFFIDLMSLSTEAGLDFIGGLQKIVDKSEDSVLAQEFEKVLRDIKLGSTREKSLKDMAVRLDIQEVTSFVNVLTDADSTGASISDVLKEQSIQMRLERFVRAEKAGARASQAILLPLILFILPAVFIMVFAPVALQFFYGGK